MNQPIITSLSYIILPQNGKHRLGGTAFTAAHIILPIGLVTGLFMVLALAIDNGQAGMEIAAEVGTEDAGTAGVGIRINGEIDGEIGMVALETETVALAIGTGALAIG